MPLSISRSLNEKLFIGDDITIVVESLTGKYVSLSIEAPSNVLVDREEIRLKRLMGVMGNRKDEGEVIFSLDEIAGHISDVADLHRQNRNEVDTIRLMRLLKGFAQVPDEYLLAVIEALNDTPS